MPTQICQSCKAKYQFDPEDLEFYKLMQVDPPPYCPPCGIQRTSALRNERIIHRRGCDLCKKPGLAMYHADAPYVVYCHDCWWSDKWDGTSFGMAYDPARPLLDQFKELQSKVPREALIVLNSTNANFTNHFRDSKDGYFSFLVANAERVLYSVWIIGKDVLDCHKVVESELVGHCLNITKCYRCAYVSDSSDSTDCYFSYDLKNCTNCIFSSNLRNKSYCIGNKQLTKPEYEREAARILDGSYETLQRSLREYAAVKQAALRRYAVILKSSEVTGNYLNECGKCKYIFDGENNEQVKYAGSVLTQKNVQYCYAIGVQPGEFIFGSAVIKGGSRVAYSFNCTSSSDLRYCDSMISCLDSVACVGLKQKKYCILNKEYPQAKYEKIVAGLREKGELAKFFPPAFSTFAYNETAANDFYPLTKEQALAQGFTWQDDFPFLTGKETMKSEDLPDNIKDAQDTLVKEMLKCVDCGRNYTLVKTEIALRKALQLPLPRECPQCRMSERRNERLPYRLWHRRCMCDRKTHMTHSSGPCPNEFETSYAPERKEMVYCEVCYQAEVV